MKYLQFILLLMFSVFAYSISAQVQTEALLEAETLTAVDFKDGPAMTFDNPQKNIGKIKRGDKKAMEFHFTNTGTEDLKIEIVSGCECTTLDWPRLPIKPGDSGVITALFDSTEKEKSEVVDIDINLENLDEDGYPMFVRVQYAFELVTD